MKLCCAGTSTHHFRNVIPAKAGIRGAMRSVALKTGFRRNDDPLNVVSQLSCPNIRMKPLYKENAMCPNARNASSLPPEGADRSLEAARQEVLPWNT